MRRATDCGAGRARRRPCLRATAGAGARTRPRQSSVEVGIGVVSDDNLRSGRYSGLNEEGAYGLFGIDVKSRDEATGTWFKLRGSNLGLESRELRLDYERQGQWGYSLEFSQTPRHIPYIFN